MANLPEDKIVTIKQFNETAINDYYRTYLFQVKITMPKEHQFATYKCEFISTTQTPYMTTSVQNIDYMHTQIKQSGRTTPQQWQINVRDDSWGKAFYYFNEWRKIVYGYTPSPTTPKRYKGSAEVILTSPDYTSSRQYTLHGVWPMEIGVIQLDYEQENISIFPVTLSFDYFDVQSKMSIL